MRKNILLLLLVVYSAAATSQRYPNVQRRAAPALDNPPVSPGNAGDTGATGNTGTGNTGNSGSTGNTGNTANPPSQSSDSSSSTPTSTSTSATSSTSTSSSPTSSSTKTDASTTPPNTSQTANPDSTSTPSTPPANPTSSASADAGASRTDPTSGAPGSTPTTSQTSSDSSQGTSTANTASNKGDDSSSVPVGTIVGLSVAGGVAVLAFVAFLIWKLTRKRFHDLDEVDEAIKWPDVGRDHSSNVGYATGPSTDALSRQISDTYSAPSREYIPEVNDPYAVPPLPQFNPNFPYRDDPQATGYYDPYRGPVPTALYESSADGHENIPLNTLQNNPRTRSPAPGVALDVTGRGSPAPGALYQGPGGVPSALGRSSPALPRGY